MMTSLGPGRATAINNLGEVAGNNKSFGYLYSNGTFTNLGSLAGNFDFLTLPNGINDFGDVVGTSSNGITYRGFVYKGGNMVPLPDFFTARDINNRGEIVGEISFEPGPV
jgi:probable HAF family extracellular repeat protein